MIPWMGIPNAAGRLERGVEVHCLCDVFLAEPTGCGMGDEATA